MNSLPTVYQQFIYKSRYARWNEEFGRREEWPETVARYFNFFETHLKDKYGYSIPNRSYLEDAILNLKVMPSMRALMTAGPALHRDNMAGFNCAYIPIDDLKSFDEILYVLMCGTGIGFSVERQFTNRLPYIPSSIVKSDNKIIVVHDSKIGWAVALRELIISLYEGIHPIWDTSKLRLAGARLKTFGGRSSGPEPLIDLFKFIVRIFHAAKGGKLSSLDCHDIVCKIAEVVVVGGVRRSALLSLSDLNDSQMRSAKVGQWWESNPQRSLANNSAVYLSPPNMDIFMDEWHSLYNSKSGERGIYSRFAAINQIEKNGRRNTSWEFGSNPCNEVLLRPYQTCNLSEIILRPNDTKTSILDKLNIGATFGTWQSTLDNFRYVRKRWSDTQKEERLLGVSLTGIFDFDFTSLSDGSLIDFKNTVIDTNKQLASNLGINQSTATTCIKPSGTVSQLTDAASGIHPRHSPYYMRTVRGDKNDPLTRFLMNQGVPYEDCVVAPKNTTVFTFPQKSPSNSICRTEISAIEHLELYLAFQDTYCEHKPSITISVKEHEWLDVGAWVYKHMNELIGVSFLPYSDHSYRQAPYQDCSEGEYNEAMRKFPQEINWNRLIDYEKEDNTVASQELACVSGVCEIL